MSDIPFETKKEIAKQAAEVVSDHEGLMKLVTELRDNMQKSLGLGPYERVFVLELARIAQVSCQLGIASARGLNPDDLKPTEEERATFGEKALDDELEKAIDEANAEREEKSGKEILMGELDISDLVDAIPGSDEKEPISAVGRTPDEVLNNLSNSLREKGATEEVINALRERVGEHFAKSGHAMSDPLLGDVPKAG